VPETVELWFQRACAKEPLERFQSADEMTEALQAAAGGPLLSKHKSAPEGRIAPATLVGLATPPQLTQDGAALARTLQLPHAASPEASAATSPGYGSPHGGPVSPPVAIAIQSERRFVSGDFELPKRNFKPLVIAIGLALLALSSVALTLRLLQSPAAEHSDASPAPAPSAQPSLAAPAEPKTAPTTTATVSPGPVGSSVAAESAPLPERPASAGKRAPLARPPASPAPVPKAAPAKPHGSDLGF
jgi:hypothetical protein